MLLIVGAWVLSVVLVVAARAVLLRERALHPVGAVEGVMSVPDHGTVAIRVAAVAVAVASVGVAAGLTHDRVTEIGADEVATFAYDAFVELDGLDGSERLDRDDVVAAFDEVGAGDRLQVLAVADRSAPSVTEPTQTKDQFQVATQDGEGTVCLTISYVDEGPARRSVAVDDGLC